MSSKLPNGFTARPGSLDDIPAAADLFNTYSQHYLGIQGFSENTLANDWTTPKFNPETDIRLVFEPDGELVAYIEVWTISNPPVHPWVWGRVHPDYTGQGIGTYLLDWGEQRARLAIPNCPEDLRVAYRVGAVSSIEPPEHLYDTFGLKLIRHYFRMQIDMDSAPPEPKLPEGICIQTPLTAEEVIEAVYRVDNEAFKDHFGYIAQPFEEGLAEFSHWFLNNENHNDASLWFLAMDGDEIAGIALCLRKDEEDDGCGHVDSLAVRRRWRKRGIGLALLQHAFGEYYRRCFRRVSLGVDANNLTGALRLYKKAGMRVSRQFNTYEKELRSGKEIRVESIAI
ncbi:MAG: GNAT family N-acetyltransferase [Anaerolineales bacterium]|nr:GNAT family N-acetyltransferase [Chloroflexota bacterium]MBL6980800.1 GNAT family N-acetyltransferase [Anaerolineales bacterium]